jgi:hypothetical protein
MSDYDSARTDPHHGGKIPADAMREYLEQRELDLEKRIAGLEALLSDAQQDIEQFKYVLEMVHTTLVAHGKVDFGTDLHKRLMKALEFDAATIAKLNT